MNYQASLETVLTKHLYENHISSKTKPMIPHLLIKAWTEANKMNT